MDYIQLNQKLTQDITDLVYKKSINGFLYCCEKLGKTADEAFEEWVKIHS